MFSLLKHIYKMIKNKVNTPLVVILGTTGTGKSKLALELAQIFKGEIISADSMQVYRRLDIVTNKVTPEERRMVPHHMLDFVDPLSEFTASDFQILALPKVRELLSAGSIPYIVGGTNYYIETLLWDILLPQAEDLSSPARPELVFSKATPSPELHKLLATVDPASAQSLHPNNHRKILRSLAVYQHYGRPHSEILEAQKHQDGGNCMGGPLRFPNTIIFWLQGDQTVLDCKLDARVDQMLELGLLEELLQFHSDYNHHRLQQNLEPDYTRGIFQSIGFKEFHPYLILPEEEKNSEDGQKLLQHCVEEMKRVTRRYARIQLKWIRNRFLKRGDRNIPPMYALDVTHPSHWEQNVRQPAIDILTAVIQGCQPSLEPLPIQTAPPHIKTTHFCEPCQRTFVGENIWKIHLGSNNHKRTWASKRWKERMLEIKNEKERLKAEKSTAEDMIH